MRELGARLAGKEALSLPGAHQNGSSVLSGVQVVNGYEIDRVIGKGRSSQVAAARTSSGEQVALKFFTTNHYSPYRFQREVTIHNMAQEVAPHVVSLIDFDVFPQGSDCSDSRVPFIVMERADESLLERVRRSPLEVDEAIDLVAQTAEGLGALHDAHIVHSDIKLGNLLVTEDNVLICDFGGSMRQGLDTVYNGTIPFIAPEQVLKTREPSPAVDQYALEVSFVALIDGRPIFSVSDRNSYERIVGSDDYNSQVAARTQQAVPRELQGPIRRALRQNPDDRFPSVTVFAQELVDRRREALDAAAEVVLFNSNDNCTNRRVRQQSGTSVAFI
jgi:eukaryotic-like serine/threonine-protein kinase